MGIAI